MLLQAEPHYYNSSRGIVSWQGSGSDGGGRGGAVLLASRLQDGGAGLATKPLQQ